MAVTVWAGISATAKTDLVFIEGNLNAHRYISEVLMPHMLPSLSQMPVNNTIFQGPVVQSVVSLTSSLRVISLTILTDSIYNILIFFAEKMWVAFALQKLLTFFSKKFWHICVSLDLSFNELLTNDVVSFEQLGPGWQCQASSSAHCRWLPAYKQCEQNGLACDVSLLIMYRACSSEELFRYVWRATALCRIFGGSWEKNGPEFHNSLSGNSCTLQRTESVNAGVIMLVTHAIEHYWLLGHFFGRPL